MVFPPRRAVIVRLGVVVVVAVGDLYNEFELMSFTFPLEASRRMFQVTSEQMKAAERGEAVRIEADGKAFVLLSQAIYEEDLDFSPWTQQEIDLLADESMLLVSNDGLDEADDP